MSERDATMNEDGWECNRVTFRYEDFGTPLSPQQRLGMEARERWERKFWNRARRAKSFTKGRLRDTWGVLLHGLPDDRW